MWALPIKALAAGVPNAEVLAFDTLHDGLFFFFLGVPNAKT